MNLKPSDVDLLQSIADGKTSKQYAREHNIHPGAVRTHKARLIGRLGQDSVTKTILRAISLGLIK